MLTGQGACAKEKVVIPVKRNESKVVFMANSFKSLRLLTSSYDVLLHPACGCPGKEILLAIAQDYGRSIALLMNQKVLM